MKNQPICGDQAKFIDNLEGSVFHYLAIIKGSITKIVTRTEILALVFLQWNANFKKYRPNLGDMPKLMDN